MVAGAPKGGIRVPGVVRELAGERSIEPVWRNELGGLTFRLGSAADAQYLKWAPLGSGANLDLERQKLQWAITYTPVPKVVDCGSEADGTWLVTEGIIGDNAVAPQWKANPQRAAVAIGKALRSMHDSLPLNECPFSWSTESRIKDIGIRSAEDQLDPKGWSSDVQDRSLDDALARVESPPQEELLVLCHGDACAPNTLLNDRGDWVAHLDLESLGVGDRWADLAVAA